MYSRNYITFRKNRYEKHILTNKHLKQYEKNKENSENEHICLHCNKSYKHYKSLLGREKT